MRTILWNGVNLTISADGGRKGESRQSRRDIASGTCGRSWSEICRSFSIETNLCGTPSVLVDNSRIIDDHMRHESMTWRHLFTALREDGVSELRQVRMAVPEVDGSMSVVEFE